MRSAWRADKPQSVRWAVFLLYTALGIDVFGTVVYATEAKRMMSDLFVLCLTWVVIYRISRGRNWARILYLVGCVLGLLVAAASVLHGFEVPGLVIRTLDYFSATAYLSAAALLVGRSSAKWFEPRRNFG